MHRCLVRLCPHRPRSSFEPTTIILQTQVLSSALCDCHAAQRASFAAALYHEARGEDDRALHLLVAVAGGASDGDVYMQELARCHLRVLRKRMAAMAVPRWRSAVTGFETPRVIRGGWYGCMCVYRLIG